MIHATTAFRVVLLSALIMLMALPQTAAADAENDSRAAEQDSGRTAQRPWWDRAAERQVGAYWIKTDVPAEQANELARHLNLMYEEFSRRLAVLPPRTPEQLNVLIFSRHREYVHVLRTRYGVNATGTGGMFFASSAGTALAFFTEHLSQRRIEHVLQHEGFHQFAHSRFGNDLPVWANEGLAEFFGEAVLVGRDLIIGQTTPTIIERVRNAIEAEKHIPFRQMLNMTSASWGSAVREGDASLQYHQAWSMVHFLVYGDDGKYVEAFEQYLKLLNSGVRSEEAFIRAFGTDNIDAFERQWKEYASRAKPSSFVTALERLEFLAEGLLELKRRGIYPESMEELKTKLQEIEFTYARTSHAMTSTLRASDNTLFTIPLDDLSRDQPVFEMRPYRMPRNTLRHRKLNEANPAPHEIDTKHLRSRGLALRWVRSEDNESMSYRIDVE